MVPEYPTTSVFGNNDPNWMYATMTSSSNEPTTYYSISSTLDIKDQPFKNRKERRAEMARKKHGKSKHNKTSKRRW